MGGHSRGQYRHASSPRPDKAEIPSLTTTYAGYSASRVKFLRNSRSKVAEHTVRPGALEGDQAFHHRLLAIQPAVAGGSHQHRIFTGHLVGESRPSEHVFDAPHNVEIGQPGLDHDH